MRTIVMYCLVLTICSLNLLAESVSADPKPANPTKEQLDAAKDAYAKFGAKYECIEVPITKVSSHVFTLSAKTTDADLKGGLPALPFRFALHLPNTKVTDAGLKELKGLNNLNVLVLNNTQVTDAGLKELKGLNNLEILSLDGTKVTDAGLKELKGLKNLTRLYLKETKVTDAGLKELKELKNLERLDLSGTKVTDAGLKELKGLNNLRLLDLRGSKVTDDGVTQLRDALPDCQIDK
jgi:hypothetical protein